MAWEGPTLERGGRLGASWGGGGASTLRSMEYFVHSDTLSAQEVQVS
jgi:hypothetical protein